MGAARPYIGQVTCQGEGALQQVTTHEVQIRSFAGGFAAAMLRGVRAG
jgi:hypothetical protein